MISLFLLGCDNGELEKLKKENKRLNQSFSGLKEQMISTELMSRRLTFMNDQIKDIRANIITSKGTITVRFYTDKAPIHVLNFLLLSEGGFYNGTKFHRVMKGFMIQGGDPNSKDNDPTDDGRGGSTLILPAEFNDIHHGPGILSMARGPNPNTARSQFFIMHGDNGSLDEKYSAFGEVVRGMDVVNAIAETKTSKNDRPLRDVVIKKIEVYRIASKSPGK